MKEWLEKGKRIKRKYLIMFLIIWAAQMAAAFYFCVQKQGFHEDEYYTYYSTARTNGFYVEDGQWMDRETYLDEFVVLPGQRFQYELVKQVQSWDVHPPVYYWVFHTAASLVPGMFSKWIGLSVNLVLWGINIVLLAYLAYVVSGRSEKLSLLVTFAYGLSPAALSGVVFIRMYEMLTMFVLICAILHVRTVSHMLAGRWNKLPVFRCLVPMAVVTYLGFLTQYYYFIFLFYLAAAFCVWLLWRERKIWNCLRYGVSQGVAFVLAYLTYPFCLGQMFRGQRGAQATENFFDLSNTVQRFRFFYELLDEYVFGKMLPAVLLLILILAVTDYRQRSMRKLQYVVGNEGQKESGEEKDSENRIESVKEDDNEKRKESGKEKHSEIRIGDRKGEDSERRIEGGKEGKKREENRKEKELSGQKKSLKEEGIVYILLAAAALGYFLTVSKTALLLGDTSNRYQLPVYGMIVLLLFQAVWVLWKRVVTGNKAGKMVGRRLLTARTEADRGHVWEAAAHIADRSYIWVAMAVICLLIDVMGLMSDRVVFLYPEDRGQVNFARERERENTPVIYLYDPGAEWCIWDVADELFAYSEVYFAAADSMDEIRDERIGNADALVVYIVEGADAEVQIGRIAESNKKLSGSLEGGKPVFEEKYCDVYYLR